MALGLPEGQGVGTWGKRGVASFSLLPLIMDFLIKITRTMLARNASTCFYFSQLMETTCRTYPFLFSLQNANGESRSRGPPLCSVRSSDSRLRGAPLLPCARMLSRLLQAPPWLVLLGRLA